MVKAQVAHNAGNLDPEIKSQIDQLARMQTVLQDTVQTQLSLIQTHLCLFNASPYEQSYILFPHISTHQPSQSCGQPAYNVSAGVATPLFSPPVGQMLQSIVQPSNAAQQAVLPQSAQIYSSSQSSPPQQSVPHPVLQHSIPHQASVKTVSQQQPVLPQPQQQSVPSATVPVPLTPNSAAYYPVVVNSAANSYGFSQSGGNGRTRNGTHNTASDSPTSPSSNSPISSTSVSPVSASYLNSNSKGTSSGDNTAGDVTGSSKVPSQNVFSIEYVGPFSPPSEDTLAISANRRQSLIKRSTSGTEQLSGKFRCDHCGRVYTLHRSLMQHLKIHMDKCPYQCSDCGRRFSRKGHVEAHIRTHTQEKPYSCRTCAKSFNQKSGLARHIRAHRHSQACKFASASAIVSDDSTSP